MPYYVAEVHAGLGDHDRTLAELNVAQQRRFAAVVLRVLVEPEFDVLSSEECVRLAVPLPATASR